MTNEWQPIETAPRDGTWLLLFCPAGVGDDYCDRDYGCRDAPAITIGNHEAGDWQVAGWYSVETYTEVHDYGGYTGVCESTTRLPLAPTHWMPLPPAPEAGQ